MTPEPDPPTPARSGPGGRSAAARPGSGRDTVRKASAKAPPQTPPSAGSPVTKSAVAKPAIAKGVAPAPVAPASRPKSVAVRPASRGSVVPLTSSELALSVRSLTKTFGTTVAVDSVDLEIRPGSLFGFVGPNGAGKTTTLSMITGLLRPDSGVVMVYGADVWGKAAVAKKSLGVLPDRLRLFDRLTGSEFLHHAGALRGLDRDTVALRVEDLVEAFQLEHALHRFVSDYSAGLVKKISIAAAMIHSPRILVLDEPFESVDPVSAAGIVQILKKYASAGGTVLLSSHSMELIERVCDSVAIIADGRMLAAGPLDEVCRGESLESRFVELAGGETAVAGMEWLQSYSD